MAQMPISDKIFSELFELKSKAIQARNGKAITWDNVITAMCKIAQKNEKEFLNIMQNVEVRKHEK
jgi:hypothetical protein